MTPSPQDEAVLRQLAEHGDNHAIVRPVIHWFFGERSSLELIASQLGSLGWTDLQPRQDEDGWLMSPTKNTDLSNASILLMNSEIELASANLDVTYDGWETSVEKVN